VNLPQHYHGNPVYVAYQHSERRTRVCRFARIFRFRSGRCVFAVAPFAVAISVVSVVVQRRCRASAAQVSAPQQRKSPRARTAHIVLHAAPSRARPPLIRKRYPPHTASVTEMLNMHRKTDSNVAAMKETLEACVGYFAEIYVEKEKAERGLAKMPPCPHKSFNEKPFSSWWEGGFPAVAAGGQCQQGGVKRHQRTT